jgi:hypothetical protein
MRERVIVERVAGMLSTVVKGEQLGERVNASGWMSERLKGKGRRDATELCHTRPSCDIVSLRVEDLAEIGSHTRSHIAEILDKETQGYGVNITEFMPSWKRDI